MELYTRTAAVRTWVSGWRSSNWRCASPRLYSERPAACHAMTWQIIRRLSGTSSHRLPWAERARDATQWPWGGDKGCFAPTTMHLQRR
jgi:hypothetical protein